MTEQGRGVKTWTWPARDADGPPHPKPRAVDRTGITHTVPSPWALNCRILFLSEVSVPNEHLALPDSSVSGQPLFLEKQIYPIPLVYNLHDCLMR